MPTLVRSALDQAGRQVTPDRVLAAMALACAAGCAASVREIVRMARTAWGLR